MAQHLLDAVPRHVRFNAASTRNLLLRNISKGDLLFVHVSQGRSTPCIGDGRPPTFNRESLQWVYKPLLLG